MTGKICNTQVSSGRAEPRNRSVMYLLDICIGGPGAHFEDEDRDIGNWTRKGIPWKRERLSAWAHGPDFNSQYSWVYFYWDQIQAVCDAAVLALQSKPPRNTIEDILTVSESVAFHCFLNSIPLKKERRTQWCQHSTISNNQFILSLSLPLSKFLGKKSIYIGIY